MAEDVAHLVFRVDKPVSGDDESVVDCRQRKPVFVFLSIKAQSRVDEQGRCVEPGWHPLYLSIHAAPHGVSAIDVVIGSL